MDIQNVEKVQPTSDSAPFGVAQKSCRRSDVQNSLVEMKICSKVAGFASLP
jgi:hypothetical protein